MYVEHNAQWLTFWSVNLFCSMCMTITQTFHGIVWNGSRQPCWNTFKVNESEANAVDDEDMLKECCCSLRLFFPSEQLIWLISCRLIILNSSNHEKTASFFFIYIYYWHFLSYLSYDKASRNGIYLYKIVIIPSQENYIEFFFSVIWCFYAYMCCFRLRMVAWAHMSYWQLLLFTFIVITAEFNLK